jgi:hypothetical protein
MSRSLILLGSGVIIAAGGFSLVIAGRLSWGVNTAVGLIVVGIGLLLIATLQRSSDAESVTDRSSPNRLVGAETNAIVDSRQGLDSGSVITGIGSVPGTIDAPRPETPALALTPSATNPSDYFRNSISAPSSKVPGPFAGYGPETTLTPSGSVESSPRLEGGAFGSEPASIRHEDLSGGSGYPNVGVAVPPSPSSGGNATAFREVGVKTTLSNSRNGRSHAAGSFSVPSGTETPPIPQGADPDPLPSKSSPFRIEEYDPASAPRSASTPQSTRCADCRKSIHDPKTWRRCPDCHHQLCTHCIVDALLNYEVGWCTHCAGIRHLDLMSKDLGSAGRAVSAPSSRASASGLTLPRPSVKSPVSGPGEEWKEPEWFVRIPGLRTGSVSARRSTAGPRHPRPGRDSSPGVPAPSRRRASHRRGPSLSAAMN